MDRNLPVDADVRALRLPDVLSDWVRGLHPSTGTRLPPGIAARLVDKDKLYWRLSLVEVQHFQAELLLEVPHLVLRVRMSVLVGRGKVPDGVL